MNPYISSVGTSQKVAQSLLEEHGWNVIQPEKSPRFKPDAMDSRQSVVSSCTDKDGLLPGTVSSYDLSAGGLRAGGLRTNAHSCALSTRLRRGISNTMNNVDIISNARDLVLLHGIKELVQTSSPDNSDSLRLDVVDALNYTFILPDTSLYPEDFRTFLHKDLIETTTLVSLEQAGRLNWWADIQACQRLLPLATTGDGNCLLHAASLGIWGFHDRRLTLRKALCQTLTESNVKDAFQRRWRYHQSQINKQSGLIYSEEEWNIEWNSLLKLASPQPRTNGVSSETKVYEGGLCADDSSSEVFYESLEELHVFVLAHVLCRPIIIVADTILKDANGDAMAPISFGGIYLPLERRADECYRTPLLLTYDAAHFSAIVPMESAAESTAVEDQETDKDSPVTKLAAAIPLVDPDFNLLPIHFDIDPGVSWNGTDCLDGEDPLILLHRYLDIEDVPIPGAKVPLGSKTLPVVTKNISLLTTIPKAGSWSELARTGSVESEDSSYTGFSTSHRDKRKGSMRERKVNGVVDETNSKSSTLSRNKLPLPVQNVARSFGSLGRSFKKLKKNLSMIAKRGASKRIDKKESASVSAADDASNGISTLKLNRSRITCARLLHRRQPYQEEMVRNYLASAKERFERECNKQQLTEGDQINGKPLSDQPSSVGAKMSCVNVGCDGTGDASTAYLCADCFDRQQQDEISATSSMSQQPGRVSSVPAAVSSVCATSARYGSPAEARAPVNVGGGYVSNGSSVLERRQFSDTLESNLDELQRTVDRIPSVINVMAMKVD